MIAVGKVSCTPAPRAPAEATDLFPRGPDAGLRARPVVDATVDLDASVDTDEYAALVELRRSAETLFGAIASRLAEASRRAQEAEELRAAAIQAKEAWEREKTALHVALEAERARLRKEWDALEQEKCHMAAPSARQSDVLALNVGGERIVQRRRSTLCAVADSFLAARFSGRWEHELDRDQEGRYFINYPPELFMPLLDYLGVKETEDPAKEVPLPQGPGNARPQFQAMLRYFGMLPAVSVLDAVNVPYDGVTFWDHGLAFEVVPKQFSLFLVALETCAGRSVATPAAATMYITQGTLLRRLRQKDEWRQVAVGTLRSGRASRLELTEPVFLQAQTSHCIYIGTNSASGIAFGEEARCSEVCAENDDMQVHAGRTSGSMAHFAGFEGFIHWYPFNGKIEYTLADGL